MSDGENQPFRDPDDSLMFLFLIFCLFGIYCNNCGVANDADTSREKIERLEAKVDSLLYHRN